MKTTDLNALHADAKSAIAGMVQRLHGKPAAGGWRTVTSRSCPQRVHVQQAFLVPRLKSVYLTAPQQGRPKALHPCLDFAKTPNTVTYLEGLRGLGE